VIRVRVGDEDRIYLPHLLTGELETKLWRSIYQQGTFGAFQ
jgi:hypothetical protein